MFYDLNVPWSAEDRGLQRTLVFLDELGYNVVALTHTLSGKLPADLSCPIPTPLPFAVPNSMRILRRCTLVLSDSAQNWRLASLNTCYDIVAVRPTDEKSLKHACETADCDLISLDLTQRYPFFFKFKMLAQAIERGVRLEVCYAPGILATNADARRNLISNVVQLTRATRGRGLIISSEAKTSVGCRSPWDVINLTQVWGLGQERGKEAISREARSAVATAALKRSSYRGVVNIVYGGERPEPKKETVKKNEQNNEKKRKAEDSEPKQEQPISKREQKRRVAKARHEEEQKKKADIDTSPLVASLAAQRDGADG